MHGYDILPINIGYFQADDVPDLLCKQNLLEFNHEGAISSDATIRDFINYLISKHIANLSNVFIVTKIPHLYYFGVW